MEGLCEHSIEPSGSLKYCRFLDLLGNCQLLKKAPAPCSWLVSWFVCVRDRGAEGKGMWTPLCVSSWHGS
jgi:hypothetical protein